MFHSILLKGAGLLVYSALTSCYLLRMRKDRSFELRQNLEIQYIQTAYCSNLSSTAENSENAILSVKTVLFAFSLLVYCSIYPVTLQILAGTFALDYCLFSGMFITNSGLLVISGQITFYSA